MNLTEAVQFMTDLELAVIKARSNIMETLGIEDASEDSPAMNIAVELNPWLFGPKSIQPAIEKINRAVRHGASLNGFDVMNMIEIARKDWAIELAYAVKTGNMLPVFDMKNIVAWDNDSGMADLLRAGNPYSKENVKKTLISMSEAPKWCDACGEYHHEGNHRVDVEVDKPIWETDDDEAYIDRMTDNFGDEYFESEEYRYTENAEMNNLINRTIKRSRLDDEIRIGFAPTPASKAADEKFKQANLNLKDSIEDLKKASLDLLELSISLAGWRNDVTIAARELLENFSVREGNIVVYVSNWERVPQPIADAVIKLAKAVNYAEKEK